jgi:DNA-binding transcriptional LysR family regulator
MIDSRQLEMFQQVIEAGSFSAAARALHCSQPAVSQQMRSLERAMGGPLFRRVGRTLRLTDAGTVLARHSAAILEDLALARRQVRAMAALDVGTVRLCAFPSANASLVPAAAAALRGSAPRIRLELIEKEPPVALAMLRRSECDVVVGFSYDEDPGDADGTIRVPLMSEPVELLVPAGHALADAGTTPVELSSLAGEQWIAGCPTCRVTFVEACAVAGFVPDIVCSTDDNMALQSLVAAGLGVTLVPRMVLSFLHHPMIVAVPVTPCRRRRIAAYTTPDLARIEAVTTVLETLRTVARP